MEATVRADSEDQWFWFYNSVKLQCRRVGRVGTGRQLASQVAYCLEHFFLFLSLEILFQVGYSVDKVLLLHVQHGLLNLNEFSGILKDWRLMKWFP